jgi:hypothetical protein
MGCVGPLPSLFSGRRIPGQYAMRCAYFFAARLRLANSSTSF